MPAVMGRHGEEEGLQQAHTAAQGLIFKEQHSSPAAIYLPSQGCSCTARPWLVLASPLRASERVNDFALLLRNIPESNPCAVLLEYRNTAVQQSRWLFYLRICLDDQPRSGLNTQTASARWSSEALPQSKYTANFLLGKKKKDS